MTSTSKAELRIPTGLLPADGRFGSGPSKVRPEALAALGRASPALLGTSHRQAPVRDLVRRIQEGLGELWALPPGYQVVLGNGGSTLFWDVAAFCLIAERSQHLVFGEFSAKFAEVAGSAPHLGTPEVRRSEYGTRPSPLGQPGIDLYALTHNETSTGVAGDLTRPPGAERDALVAVDATSAAGAMPFDPAGVDVYYFAPQKAFGSDGGLWFAVLSPAAVARVGSLAPRWRPASLDLAAAVEQSRLHQTLNTPAVATLVLMANQLEWILANGGMSFTAGRSRASADVLYGWAEASSYARPFVAEPAQRSPVVGTIDFDDRIDAAEVASILRVNGILDTEPYRKLGRNQLRIGMFPAVDPADVSALTACIDHVIARL